MEDALANWQWLIAVPRSDDALLLAADESTSDRFLTEGFAHTRRETASPALLDSLAPASLDCVAVPDPAALRKLGMARTQAFRLVHRALRPGAGVYVGIEEIHSADGRRSLLAAATQLFNRQTPRLQRAGFRSVQTYYLVQSPESPRNFVPATARALIAWDTSVSAPDWRMRLRHLIYRLGLSALLLRYRLIVARA